MRRNRDGGKASRGGAFCLKQERVRVRFKKEEDAKFIGHLDLMRLLERALRRARVSIAYSGGFNPHPRMSLASALPLGTSSEAEYADFILNAYVPPREFVDKMNLALPAGVVFMKAQSVPLGAPSLASIMESSRYSATACIRHACDADLRVSDLKTVVGFTIRQLLERDHIPVRKPRADRVVNLRSLILGLVLGALESECSTRRWILTLDMCLVTNPRASARPNDVLAAFAEELAKTLAVDGKALLTLDEASFRFHRSASYFRSHSGLVEPLPL